MDIESAREIEQAWMQGIIFSGLLGGLDAFVHEGQSLILQSQACIGLESGRLVPDCTLLA